MKKALLVLFATGWFLCGFAQEIKFETVEHDFGNVNYDESPKYEFIFTNSGSEPLIVQKPARKNGSILLSWWPKDPILPGKKDKISVVLRINRAGWIENSVTVTSNAKNAPKITLRVKGFVWPEGIKVYQKNDLWSFEYNNGGTIPYQQYDQVLGGDDDVKLMKKGKWGVVGRTNVIPCEYDERFGFADSMTVKKGGKWGVIDKENRVIIPFEYDEICENGWAKKGGKWGIIDKKSKVIIPFEYEDINYLTRRRTGRGIAKKGGKWGEIDIENNNVIIPFEYEELSPYVDVDWTPHESPYYKKYVATGALFAKKNGKWGSIDKENKVIIPFEYDDINIRMGRGIVKKGGKWGEINIENNNVIVPFEYEDLDVDVTGAGALFAKKNGKWGEIKYSKSGEHIIIIPFEYNELKELKKAYHIRY